MITTKKGTGSFFTPINIAQFTVNYLTAKISINAPITILEPSAGDGVFLKAVFNNKRFLNQTVRLLAVERNEDYIESLNQYNVNESVSTINDDFLYWQERCNEKFSLVLGNPPYIKSRLLSKKQLEYCSKIHHTAELSATKPKNIWTAFLVRSIELLSEDGLIAFILPAELLQVKFAEELQKLIRERFQRIEVFLFKELLFKECKGQDTILLIGEKKSSNPGLFFCNVKKIDDLIAGNFNLCKNEFSYNIKWTNFYLDSDEIQLLEMLKTKMNYVNNYCDSKTGIVTAANDYFIFNSEILKKYELGPYVKPIIQKGQLVNNYILFTSEDFIQMKDRSAPAYLLTLSNSVIKITANNIKKYLKVGLKKGIDKQYKMRQRERWYEVPNVGNPPDAFFFRRYDEFPKIVRNDARVLATDSAYLIDMKAGYEIENFIFSFYNSLTLCYSELIGRSYGGGVLELTPNEFKGIPIIYISSLPIKFDNYASKYSSRLTIKDIFKDQDKFILKSSTIQLDDDTILKIQRIREKLYQRRVKA